MRILYYYCTGAGGERALELELELGAERDEENESEIIIESQER